MAHLVNIDWLAFSVRLASSDIMEGAPINLHRPDGYTLFEASPTNIYKRRVIVYREGQKVITLLLDPHSKIIDRDAMLVEVANVWLYGDLSWVMPLLYDIHPCSMIGFSRVDICADFERVGVANDIISDLRTERVYVAEKREGSLFFSVDNGEQVNRSPHCYSWGSKHSSIRWKLYNKWLEITDFVPQKGGSVLEVCNKPYIQEAWVTAGFDPRKVWRLEVSITNASKYHFCGSTLEWSDILNRDKFESLFHALYMTRFVTRRNQGHAERRRDERVYLLGEQPAVDRVRIRPPRYESVIVEYAAGLNSAMRQLQAPEVETNLLAQDVWLRTISDIVSVGNLQPYFLRTYGKTIDSFIEDYARR